MITQDQLKRTLHYSPETGLFIWLVSTNRKIRIGHIAGTLEHGYIGIRINKEKYLAHRLAFLYMEGRWPVQVDHKDHIRNNNKWANLREVISSENCKNLSFSKSNTSGVTGVYWTKGFNKWLAQITLNYKQIYLGRYEDKFEAICARKSAENTYNFHENHGK